MGSEWPSLSYAAWSDTCDTLHAHAQIVGKIAVALAPPEPQLQHAALQLSARGWETRLLPTPNGSGGIVAALDLHNHETVVEHTDGRVRRIALTPDRPVGDVTRAVIAATRELVGAFPFDPTPQEVSWTVPLDEDEEHKRYDPEQVATYLEAAAHAALALSAFRAPYRGRSTPVNAWWGSFDLAVDLFSGRSTEPPSDDFLSRNSLDAQHFALGWWPGDPRHERAAFFAYVHPAPEGFSDLELSLGGWSAQLGEYILYVDELRQTDDPHDAVLEFGRTIFRHACAVCDWDMGLAATADGIPPAIR